MPPRRAVDDPAAELERLRELSRQRVKRYRERRNASGNVTPPHTPPLPSPLSTREIEKTLEPFAGRGYVHSERFWQLAASEYPALNLELEALKIADWLLTPKNAKRRCPKAFLDNWLKKAEQDRREREAGSASRRSINGPIDPPAAFQRNPGPAGEPLLMGALEPIDFADFQRAVAEGRSRSLKEKLASMANGRHP